MYKDFISLADLFADEKKESRQERGKQKRVCLTCDYKQPDACLPNQWCYMFKEMIIGCGQYKKVK